MFRTIQNVSFSVTWVHQGVFTENPVLREVLTQPSVSIYISALPAFNIHISR